MAGETPAPLIQDAACKAPQRDSMQEKALMVVRNSHQGVTSEEIHHSIGCATIQSAYQICFELQEKGLVKRLDSGVWQAVNG